MFKKILYFHFMVVIGCCPKILKLFKEPLSDELQLYLIKKCSFTIKYMKEPCSAVQWYILNQLDINHLRYIDNVDEDLQEHLVNIHYSLIQYIKYPKAELIKKALEGNPQCVTRLQYIPEYLQLKVIDYDEDIHPQISRDLVCENIMRKFGPHTDHFHHEFKKLKLKHGITTESVNFS